MKIVKTEWLKKVIEECKRIGIDSSELEEALQRRLEEDISNDEILIRALERIEENYINDTED